MEKSFICSYCKNKFANRATLNTHIKKAKYCLLLREKQDEKIELQPSLDIIETVESKISDIDEGGGEMSPLPPPPLMENDDIENVLGEIAGDVQISEIIDFETIERTVLRCLSLV